MSTSALDHKGPAGKAVRADLRRMLGRDWALGYTLMLPAAVVLFGLIAYPFVTSLYLSLQSQPIGMPGSFVGLDNYARLFANPIYHNAVIVSVLYTTLGVGMKFVVGLTAALIMHEVIKARNLFRALLFLPWSVPAVVGAWTWRWIYDDMNGVLNHIFMTLGIIEMPILWTANPSLALWAVLAVVVWQGTPFYTMNMLAGLSSIPKELYEAAAIDGASTVDRFRHITLPGLTNVIIVTLMLSAIWTSNNLTFVYIITAGGPAHATEIFPMLTYQMGIRARELGMGAAVSLTFFPFMAVLIVFLTGRMLRREA